MKLYNHQKEIIDANPLKCGFWLGTGSGKTTIALSLAQGNTLVIAPKTQKEDGNWHRELDRIKIDQIENKQRHNISYFIVVSKEEFRRDWQKLLKEKWQTVIIDEAHTVLGATPNYRYVNKKRIPKCSQLFDALQSFLKVVNPERIYLCTATIVKSPMTVWAASRVLGRDWDFETWRRTFYFPLNMPGRDVWVPKKDTETKDRLAKAVQGLGYVGRLSDYFDVPDQTFINKHIELTEKQKNRIKELSTEYPDPLVLLGKKLQVENGILKGNEFSDSEVFENGKIEKILELSEEFPQMIVFAKYTQQIEEIHKALAIVGKNVFKLTGATTDRGELLAQVNSSKEYVFIVQSQISAGWEVAQCPVVVFASRTYSYTDYAQALGRVLRANALKKNLYINLIVKNGIDQAVHNALENKQSFDERLYLKL